MNLNADLMQRIVLSVAKLPWEPVNGAPGTQCLLSCDENLNASTRIVRYEAGTTFSWQTHAQKREILVLEGEFMNENDVYPAGTYLKTSPDWTPARKSVNGCTLLIKTLHTEDSNRKCIVIRPFERRWHAGLVPGLEVLALDQTGITHTALVRWAPETYFSKHQHCGGEEIFVLQGTFQDENGDYSSGTWLRNPHMSAHQPYSKMGCLIFVKVGHLWNSPEARHAPQIAFEHRKTLKSL